MKSNNQILDVEISHPQENVLRPISLGNETVSSEKISVKKLVSAGLDLLKAGKELKLNVDIKNPESIERANEVSNLGHLMISEQKLTLLAPA